MADELYLCNTSFERTDIIDDYVSMIWTDRYYAAGEIQLRFSKNAKSAAKMRKNWYLSFDKSPSHMIIDTILFDSDKNQVVVTGMCLKSLFMRRINKLAGQPDRATGGNTGAAFALMYNSVYNNLISVATPPGEDRFTKFAAEMGFVPFGGGPETNRDSSATTVYDELVSMSQGVNVGWDVRYYKDFTRVNGSHVYDSIVYHGYMGVDRSDRNTDGRPEIIFDPILDNIENVSFIDSNANFISDVAVVDPESTSGFFYVRGWIPPMDPFNVERRVRMIRMGNEKREDYTRAQWVQLMNSYARKELAKAPPQYILDGRLLNDGPFTYGFDYNMGDRVTIGIDQVNPQKARIIEYIWSYDQNGVKEYPTFKVVTGEAV